MLAPLLVAVCCAVQDPAAAPRPSLQVVGRLVDEHGAPQAAITVRVFAGGAPRQAGTQTTHVTDEDGCFALDLAGHGRDTRLALSFPAPGYATTHWIVDRIGSSPQFDVGTLVLKPEGIVTGHIVDSTGALLTEGWVVLGHATAALEGRATTRDSASATIDPLTGLFTLRGLPAGTVSVLAKGPLGAQTEHIALEAVAGRETEAQLVYSGSLVGQISTVQTGGPGTLQFGSMSARAEDGEVVRFRQFNEHLTQGRSWVAGLDPRRKWWLQHDDPRFEPFLSVAAQPGGETTVELVPRGAFDLEVVDAMSGAPVDAFVAEVVEPGGVRRRQIVPSSTRPTRVEEVLPATVFVSVSADGYPIHDTTLFVPVGTVPRLRIALARAAPLHGQVVTRTGLPVSGATIEATPGRTPGFDPDHSYAGSRVLGSGGGGDSLRFYVTYVAQTKTDAAGNFSLTDLAPGPVTLVVRRGNSVPAEVLIEHRAEPQASDAPPLRHLVEVDTLRTVEVRVFVPDGVDLGDLWVRALPPSAANVNGELPQGRREAPRAPFVVDNDGWAMAALHVREPRVAIQIGRVSTLVDYRPVPVATVEFGGEQTHALELTPAQLFGAELAFDLAGVIGATELPRGWLAAGGREVLPLPAFAGPTLQVVAHVAGHLPHGAPWTVPAPRGRVHPIVEGPGWRRVAKVAVSMRTGEPTLAPLPVELTWRTVMVRDNDGRPLVDTKLEVWFTLPTTDVGDLLGAVKLRTDKNGSFTALGPVEATLHVRCAPGDAVTALREAAEARPKRGLDRRGVPGSSGGSVEFSRGVDGLEVVLRAR